MIEGPERGEAVLRTNSGYGVLLDDTRDKLKPDSYERRRVYDLSGGEQQRVAIARALSHRPSVLLADEPTGNLDEKTAGSVIELLETLTRGNGSTMIMATHSTALAATCDRTFELHNGKLVGS